MRKRLFVLGNGFDVAHNLPTRYSDFRNYLYEKSIFENSKKLIRIIDKKTKDISQWSDLEALTGEINIEDISDEFNIHIEQPTKYVYRLEEWVDEPIRNKKDLEKLRLFEDTARAIREEFVNWAKSIEMNAKANCSVRNDFTQDDYLVLQFNFTLTLEELYNVPDCNICHIHGCKKDEIIEFGHGKEFRSIRGLRDSMKWSVSAEDDDGESYYPSVNICSSLYKNTENIIKNHMDFFNRLNEEISEIFVFGFSFSDVDMPYILKINENCPNAKWFINRYNATELDTLLLDKLERKGIKRESCELWNGWIF